MARYPLDDATADRLLSGSVAPPDAPPGYAGVAALLRAAGRPAPTPDAERLAAVAAASAAAVAPSPDPLHPAPRRHPMLAKLLTAKFAALASVAVLGAGTAAAAVTGNLPGSGPHVSSSVAADVTSTTAGTTTTSTTGATTTTLGTSTSTSGAVGPVTGMANGNATFGLCTAFLASSRGQDTTTTTTSSTTTGGTTAGGTITGGATGALGSTAFQALIAAHGGSASATASFCTGYVATHHPGSTAPGAPPARGTVPGTGVVPGSVSPGASGHGSASTPDLGRGHAGITVTPGHGAAGVGVSTPSGSGTAGAGVSVHGAP